MPTLSSLNCTAGHFTSWKNENVSEMYKNEKDTCKACKTAVFHIQYENLSSSCCRRRRSCLSFQIGG